MARPNFNIVCAGVCSYTTGGGLNPNTGTTEPILSVVPSYISQETNSGVTRKKPKGFIPPTNYDMTHRTVSNAYGHLFNVLPNAPFAGQRWTGTIGGATGLSGAFPSASHFDYVLGEAENVHPDIRNRALVKARNALKDTQVNLGVAFGERKATARLIGDTAFRLARSYRAIRRGEIRKAMDTLGISSKRGEPRGGNAPQKWLELQYGWKPLLSDVYGTCNALSKRDKSDWRVTAEGKSKDVVTRFKNTFDGFGVITAVSRQSCFARIDALPKNEATISLASLGITNPLLIGWELVPFSFVVDWFIPVGSWIEQLDALLGYEDFSYSSSLLTRQSWVGHGVGKKSLSNGFMLDSVYTETKQVVKLDRDVGNNVPFPHFPRFKDPRSLEHMANGLSLLAVVFGRK